jgi:thiamine biosynthesis lipoprotein
MIAHRSFRAMGTEIELVLDANSHDTAFDRAEAEFERLEQVMSRFRPTSELSQLNEAGTLDASADLADVVGLALAAREETGGKFDPTIHDALVAAGYDRTFDEVAPTGPARDGAGACGGGVTIDGHRIEVEPGYRLDLGGIGKGFAAERVAELLACSGPCLVSAGGDVAVRGFPAEGVWPVAVDDSLTLGLERGGLATSGRDRRRWRRGQEERHHLIDPSTGRSAATDILRVTAIGRTAVDAEVLAKVLFLGGLAEAIDRDAPAVLLAEDGTRVLTGGLG